MANVEGYRIDVLVAGYTRPPAGSDTAAQALVRDAADSKFGNDDGVTDASELLLLFQDADTTSVRSETKESGPRDAWLGADELEAMAAKYGGSVIIGTPQATDAPGTTIPSDELDRFERINSNVSNPQEAIDERLGELAAAGYDTSDWYGQLMAREGKGPSELSQARAERLAGGGQPKALTEDQLERLVRINQSAMNPAAELDGELADLEREGFDTSGWYAAWRALD